MAIQTAQNQIAGNVFKTWMIMFFFSLFVVGVTFIFARALGFNSESGLGIVGFALILAGIMNFFSYYFSDRMVLAMSGARQIQKSENPTLYRTVENLCIAAGLPTPNIYIINDPSPNAFATGRDKNHSAICYTSGILDRLNKQELEGVTAHELSHVNNRDTLLMSVVSILVGFVALLADWFLRWSFWSGPRERDDEDKNSGAIFFIIGIVAALLAPLGATLIQLAISRKREFLADASGAFLTRNPEELAQALIKISSDPEPVAEANTATAHLYIVNPLKGEEAVGWLANLFNTHPAIADRVKALRDMEGNI